MLKTLSVAAFGLAFSFGADSVRAADVICYNCPPEWADWASVLKALKDDVKLDVPHDNKNSGQTLSQLIAEKAQPVADVAYFGVTFGIKAKAEGVTEAYKPKGFDEIPAGLKDPDGHWFTIHSGTLGLFINKDALGDKPSAAMLEGPVEGRLPRNRRLPRSVLGVRRLCRRGGGEPRARRLAR